MSDTTDETQGAWKTYVAIGACFVFGIGLFIYAQVSGEVIRQSGARTARAVVVEKHFAPGQSVAGISSSGSYGIGSTVDRYIVAVRATEGATGIREIDVPQGVYYRLNVGTELRVIITSGDLTGENKYRVEIDPASIPTAPATPPKIHESPDTDTNKGGQREAKRG